jgi:hypothetical protein
LLGHKHGKDSERVAVALWRRFFLEFIVLSLAACRKLLPADTLSISDSDLECLRDQLMVLAQVTLETACKVYDTEFDPQNDWQVPVSLPQPHFQRFVAGLSEADRDQIMERCAILEIDAGFDQCAAEDLALSEWKQRSWARKVN